MMCVILCGGLATRLRPMTETIPKSLIPIRGKPFIEHQLRLLRAGGVTRVALCVGFLGEQIREFLKDGASFDLDVTYSFDGPKPLGTAGAIRSALPLLDDRFFVLYGDSYLPCDYRAVESAFASSGKPALMTVFHNENRYEPSNIEFAGSLVRNYNKAQRTPSMQYIDYGLGAFERSVFESVPPEQFADLADVYGRLVGLGELAGYEVRERFYEIGSMRGMQDLEEYLAAKQ